MVDGAMVKRHRAWAQGMAWKLGARHGTIEDVVQEVFARATRYAHSFNPSPDAPRDIAERRWLLAILTRVIARQHARAAHNPLDLRARVRDLRRDGDGRAYADPDDESDLMDPKENHGERIAVQHDATGILRRFYEATRDRPEQWRAWIAFEVDGVPVKEIARQEGTSTMTIYTRIRLAREDLAAMLAREEATARFTRERDAKKRRGRR
ncbi:MAG: sigma-70 family RNA polymerase sigma factor [Polyangiaceae bacterium]